MHIYSTGAQTCLVWQNASIPGNRETFGIIQWLRGVKLCTEWGPSHRRLQVGAVSEVRLVNLSAPNEVRLSRQ